MKNMLRTINIAAGLGLALTTGCVVEHGRVYVGPPVVVATPPAVVVAPLPPTLWDRARAGDPVSQFTLGSCYANGRGVPRDWVQAFRWYYLSAKHGYAPAQNRVGICYYRGYGTAQNFVAAVAWYRAAAQQGFAPAQDILGICYFSGRGVPRSYSEAARWYRLAATQGNATAAAHLRQVEGLMGGPAVVVRQSTPGQPMPTPPPSTPAPASMPAAPEPAEAAGNQMSVDEIKELSHAGVKADTLTEQIKSTNSKFTSQDIAAAQQANVDASVIECMKQNLR